MNRFFPAIFSLTVVLLVFFKIFVGLYPYPGDLLVSYNFPWYSGGWEGYDPWTTRKEFMGADAIRQHIPWLKIVFEEIRNNGNIPLWNPYNFSGTPHFANIQTFALNPLGFIFLLFPLFEAWILFVIFGIVLMMLFTYLFARSLNLNKSASFFSSLAFMFSSYFFNWLEIGIIIYTLMWLPLMLYSVTEIFKTSKLRYLLILIFSTAASILSGHIQTAVFVIFVVAIYFCLLLVKTINVRKRKLAILNGFFWLALAFLISAIQVLPTLELYLNSPLIEPLSRDVFNRLAMPFTNIITLFAPDFFGNPVTENFWSTLYGDGTPYIGVLPLFFAIFAIFSLKKIKRWEVKFFLVLSIVALLYSTRSPLYLIIKNLEIPILTGTGPTRLMFIFSFSLSMIAGFGLDEFIKSKNKSKLTKILIAIFLTVYISLFLLTTLIPMVTENSVWQQRLFVARRNLILPFLTFLSLPFAILLSSYVKRFNLSHLKIKGEAIIVAVIFVSTISAAIYQVNKVQPFSPKKFFFPNHPIINWLQENGSVDRYVGAETATIWTNFSSFYGIYSPKGYGVFRVKRYAELLASKETGQVPHNYERAEAELKFTNSTNTQRLLNLMGVKYILSKDDFARDAYINDPNKPDDNVNLIWQNGKFKIYERRNTLPRFWLTQYYDVQTSNQDILNRIYDDDFDLKTILLEEKPKLDIGSSNEATAELIKYSPDNIEFRIDTQANSLFFISDTYYPGWKALIDGVETKILRANYAFRAIEIPANSEKLEMIFDPISYKVGKFLSIIGVIIFGLSFIFSKYKLNKF